MQDNAAINNLVKRCVAGDGDAWAELVRQHNRRIYNLCYRFTGSAENAEDLAQEVFIKIYRTLDSYDVSRGAFNTWLTTMTRNLLVDHFRKSKQDRVTDSMDASPGGNEDSLTLGEKLVDPGLSPSDRLTRQETQSMVHQALQKLSPELREAVILRDLQDMDYSDIALTLRVPPGTVKSRINRGRTELARILSRINKQVM